ARRRLLIGLGEAVLDDAVDERGLVAEMMVDGGWRHAGPRTHLADGEPHLAPGRQQLAGRVEDRAPGGLGRGLAGTERGDAGGHGRFYSGATYSGQRGCV